LDQFLIRACQPPDFLAWPTWQLVPVQDEDANVIGGRMAAQRQKVVGDRRSQFFRRGIAARDDVFQIIDEIQNAQLADRKQRRLFRRQVVVEACGADAEALGDVSRAGAEIALLGKRYSCGVKHFAIAVFPLRAHVGTHVSHPHRTHARFSNER
jgi:hypothetical protein